ncbi:BolA/IbaG family iron-sulfur metabolism protein [Aristophania vespae]|uniref:BolA/IbaG family iron-sulfur metabolism protein n=1 Tax=Aristophania vespae TaxID=2697033 RepID=A0A6P1NLD7_9PROT|nr:BolA family protein [Aristophania vespae]QHI95681.1 BolA/IbaG family iron-sulfur metabolism protein [Aristophania vespae]UMM63368.1 hypothetical protein DM15PD_03280 [Aristophania vespae]
MTVESFNKTPIANQPVTNRDERMRLILEEALGPSQIEIIDESKRHAHHIKKMLVRDESGAPSVEGQTHYRINIVSSKFDDLGRLARHRLVNELLKTEFESGLHALTLTLKGEKEK